MLSIRHLLFSRLLYLFILLCALSLPGFLGASPASKPATLPSGQKSASLPSVSGPKSEEKKQSSVGGKEDASGASKEAAVKGVEISIAAKMAQDFREEYWDKGPIFTLLLLIVMGFLVSLTPCVYPMIPITIAVIGATGAKRDGSRGQAFLLSLMYVLGMCLPAVILGIVSASLGRMPFMMGAMMQSSIFLGVLVALFFAMSLSMFGLFDLNLPSSWQTRLASIQGRGFLGIFVLGMIGIVLSTPCSGPVLIGVFAFISQTGSLFLGVILPFFLVVGIGIPFLLLGGGVVSALPKGGMWMMEVKKIFGLILLAAAFYYGWFLFRSYRDTYLLVLSLVLLFFGVSAGAFRPYHAEDGLWLRLKQTFGIASLVVGLLLFTSSLQKQGYLPTTAAPSSSAPRSSQAPSLSETPKIAQASDPCLPPAGHPDTKPFWFTREKEGIACAQKLRRPVIIDFWADWCDACIRLERESFNHPDAVKESRRFVLIKIEYSEASAEGERLRKKYEIPGLPWVRFLDGQGKLQSSPLLVGFQPPHKLVSLMRSVR